jgi:hypothetical protein
MSRADRLAMIDRGRRGLSGFVGVVSQHVV